MLSFARIIESEEPSLNIRITVVFLSIVLAWLTFKLVELPLRFDKNGNAKVFYLLCSCLLLVMLVTTHLKEMD